MPAIPAQVAFLYDQFRCDVEPLEADALLDRWIAFEGSPECKEPNLGVRKRTCLESALVREFGFRWREAVDTRRRLMLEGPQGQKRPGDVIGAAIKVAKIATREITEDVGDGGKDKAAVSLGKRGGKARAKTLSARKRKEIAKIAARARWKK